jgi:tetratricopeptide (TPR) repeat protein
MNRSLDRIAGIFLLAAIGLCASCALGKNSALEISLKVPGQYLGVGDFQRAIDFYQSAFLKYPEEARVRNEYIRALELMKREADRTLEAGDYLAAEKTYTVLLENYPQFKELEPEISFRPPFLERRIRECQTILAEQRARKSIQDGDFEKAFDAYKISGMERLKDSDLSASYRYLLEEVKHLADAALAGNDFKRSGAGYAALLKEHAAAREIGLLPPFSLKSLEEGLDHCRAQLTRKGLEEYRRGNLKSAVVLWQSLLEFDPGNAEIRKAVETATEQLRKLKKDAAEKK